MIDERKPISTMAELSEQDERDMLYGYAAGFSGDGNEPSIEMNRSYWHGWRNGMVDSGRMTIDSAQQQLAHEYVGVATLGADK